MENQLNSRQIKFIELYITGMDAGVAAKKSGYKGSANACRVQGSRLLKNKDIKAEIERRQKKISDNLEIKKEDILEGLREIFKSEEHRASDRINAGAQINKMLGFYTSEKIEHQHSGQISCVVELPNNNRMNK